MLDTEFIKQERQALVDLANSVPILTHKEDYGKHRKVCTTRLKWEDVIPIWWKIRTRVLVIPDIQDIKQAESFKQILENGCRSDALNWSFQNYGNLDKILPFYNSEIWFKFATRNILDRSCFCTGWIYEDDNGGRFIFHVNDTVSLFKHLCSSVLFWYHLTPIFDIDDEQAEPTTIKCNAEKCGIKPAK